MVVLTVRCSTWFAGTIGFWSSCKKKGDESNMMKERLNVSYQVVLAVFHHCRLSSD